MCRSDRASARRRHGARRSLTPRVRANPDAPPATLPRCLDRRDPARRGARRAASRARARRAWRRHRLRDPCRRRGGLKSRRMRGAARVAGVPAAMAAMGGGGRRCAPRSVSRHVVKPFTACRERGTSRGGPAEWRTPVGVEPTDLPLAHLELVLHGISGAVYDSDRRGSTAWEESCGRNCTFPVSVPTRTAPAAAPAPGP